MYLVSSTVRVEWLSRRFRSLSVVAKDADIHGNLESMRNYQSSVPSASPLTGTSPVVVHRLTLVEGPDRLFLRLPQRLILDRRKRGWHDGADGTSGPAFG